MVYGSQEGRNVGTYRYQDSLKVTAHVYREFRRTRRECRKNVVVGFGLWLSW